jgi:hypothetical protein
MVGSSSRKWYMFFVFIYSNFGKKLYEFTWKVVQNKTCYTVIIELMMYVQITISFLSIYSKKFSNCTREER